MAEVNANRIFDHLSRPTLHVEFLPPEARRSGEYQLIGADNTGLLLRAVGDGGHEQASAPVFVPWARIARVE